VGRIPATLVGNFDGKDTIIDFKQANKLKREDWIEDYYYQIAAYSLAHKKNYGKIEQGLICIVLRMEYTNNLKWIKKNF
jgi:hypothetical protein